MGNETQPLCFDWSHHCPQIVSGGALNIFLTLQLKYYVGKSGIFLWSIGDHELIKQGSKIKHMQKFYGEKEDLVIKQIKFSPCKENIFGGIDTKNNLYFWDTRTERHVQNVSVAIYHNAYHIRSNWKSLCRILT